jgi:hypothetical protein
VKRPFICAHCGKTAYRNTGEINRAIKRSWPLYCNRDCAGLARRCDTRTDAEKRADKAKYDAEYRERNRARLKAQKAAYYQRTRDPERERAYRKATMPRHVEYCRRPEYRKWKAEYDRIYCARKDFGPFAEAALVLRDLENEISSRATRTEIYAANGTLNKWIQRRRDYENLVGR